MFLDDDIDTDIDVAKICIHTRERNIGDFIQRNRISTPNQAWISIDQSNRLKNWCDLFFYIILIGVLFICVISPDNLYISRT